MARTILAVLRQDRFTALSNVTYPPVAMDTVNGNLAANDGSTELEFTLTGGVARTVSVTIPGGVDLDLASPQRTYALPVDGLYRAGPFPVKTYGPELILDVSGAGVAVRVISLL